MFIRENFKITKEQYLNIEEIIEHLIINNKLQIDEEYKKLIKDDIFNNDEEHMNNLNKLKNLLLKNTNYVYTSEEIKNKIGYALYKQLCNYINIDNPFLIFIIIHITNRQVEINELKLDMRPKP